MKYQFEFRDDILISRYLVDEEITEELAKDLVQARKGFQGEKPVKLISAFPKLTAANKEARDYLATDEAKKGLLACAVVGKSVLARSIINFYLSISGIKDFPMKMFSNEDDAFEWLKEIEVDTKLPSP